MDACVLELIPSRIQSVIVLSHKGIARACFDCGEEVESVAQRSRREFHSRRQLLPKAGHRHLRPSTKYSSSSKKLAKKLFCLDANSVFVFDCSLKQEA